jgi:hypothetical protein
MENLLELILDGIGADLQGCSHSGGVGHRISQPVDDLNYIVVELDFNERGQAEALLAKLTRKVWGSSSAAPALDGAPRTRILTSAG